MRLSLRGNYNDAFWGCFWAYFFKKCIRILSKEVLCANFFPLKNDQLFPSTMKAEQT